MSYDGEVCMDCGFPVAHFVGSYWTAPHLLWNYVLGGPEATDDPGGILCPPCFTLRCRELGVSVAWKAEVTHVRPNMTPDDLVLALASAAQNTDKREGE